MSTHLRPLRLSGRWIGGLALVLVGLLGVLGFAHNARAASDYSVSLQTPDLVRQFDHAELTAVVKDSQGQPVNGIPVTFQVTPDWQNTTRLLPAQVLTHAGTASAVFEADMPGVVLVTVQVGVAPLAAGGGVVPGRLPRAGQPAGAPRGRPTDPP
jgi:hypothetical protein